MAKGKSSASSATRKKHAKKAAKHATTGSGDEEPEQQQQQSGTKGGQTKLQRGQKKVKKDRFAPKVKQYIPPPPPPKGAPDPLDLYVPGGAAAVEADLVVVLKRFMKKDESTLEKGIEGLQEYTNAVVTSERELPEDEQWRWQVRKDELVKIAPVWAHHFGRLATHASKRIRLLAVQLHSLLVSLSSSETTKETRAALLAPLWVEQTDYIGAWACTTFDTDRQVKAIASRSWQSIVDSDDFDLDEHAPTILKHAETVLLSATAESGEEDRSHVQVPALSVITYLLAHTSLNDPESIAFIRSSDLWSLLSSESTPIRKAAYALLEHLSTRPTDFIDKDDGLANISQAVLRTCWRADTDWPSVVIFLKKYPQAWSLADRPGDNDCSDDSEDGSDSEEEDAKPGIVESLLAFAKSACAETPANYAVLVLLLSTIPPSVLPLDTVDSADRVLDSIWQAKEESRALATTRARTQFIDAFADSLVYTALKLRSFPGSTVSADFEAGWIGRLFDWLVLSPVNVMTSTDFDKYASTLGRLAKDNDLHKLEAEVEVKVESAIKEGNAHAFTKIPLICIALQRVTTLEEHARRIQIKAADAALAMLDQHDGQLAVLGFLTSLQAAGALPVNTEQSIDRAVEEKLPPLILSSATGPTHLLSQYLSVRPNSTTTLWTRLFDPVPSTAVLLALHDVASTVEGLPSVNLDERVSVIAAQVLSDEGGTSDEEQLLQKVVLDTDPSLVSAEMPMDLIALVMQRLDILVREALFSTVVPLDALRVPVALLESFTRSSAERVNQVSSQIDWADTIFSLAHHLALPRFNVEKAAVVLKARQIWDRLVDSSGQDLVQRMTDRTRAHILDPAFGLGAIEIVDAAGHLVRSPADVARLVTTLQELEPMVHAVVKQDSAPQLAIVDPLCSYSEVESATQVDGRHHFDNYGLSSTARAVLALLDIAGRQPSWIKSHVELVYPLMLVKLALDDHRDEPSMRGRGVDSSVGRLDFVNKFANAIDGLVSFLVSSATRDLSPTWHNDTVTLVRSRKSTSASTVTGIDGLAGVLVKLFTADGVAVTYRARALSRLLGRILQYSEKDDDALRWLALAQSVPEGSWRSTAVTLAVKDTLIENPRFQRWQNELASTAAGVPPAQANDKGVRTLRSLIATAPHEDSPAIFLPQQRCIFLIQRVQAWLASDEDLDDSIHTVLAQLFVHLAPIIQDMSGSHWELMFDIIDSNLEVVSWQGTSSLVPLYHSCVLLRQLKSLTTTNRELRGSIGPALSKSTQTALGLLTSRPQLAPSKPLQLISDVMLDLVRADFAKSAAPIDKLLPLLGDPALSVQKAFYALASQSVQKNVDDLVIEAELDSEGKLDIVLSSQLMHMLTRPETTDQHARIVFLLSWLLAFEHFTKASPRIKAAYLEQLRNSELVSTALLPAVFDYTGIAGRRKIADLACWSIDSFEVQLIDDEAKDDERTVALLAAYVYYRSLQAVPSLVRAWLDACRDRQLSTAVTTVTSRFFSPILISAELAHLRDPEDPNGKSLRDNPDFTVKVAAGANEVKAVFVVDEQNMEIGIRLPSEYPLQVVEVKDVKKVGVTDAQWRAWILAVQQVITTQNGLIAEALSLFKRNVALHFDGVEACAICYSVISVVDRTLPTKACRVCNNKFHPGCLYKWFMTSHGSSCPLCRSLF